MENATKALLIAAAVLIAILIISFALIIYNMTAETVGNVNLTEAEIAEFNSKFTAFEGPSVSGTQVNALLTTVLTHNQQEKLEGTNRLITVTGPVVYLTTDANSISKKAPTSNYYKVYCEFGTGNGLVSSIVVTRK